MTNAEFENLLIEDLAWRKKEISNLLLLAKSNPNDVLLKALILMIYAHWEGFIKRSSKIYLKYISDDRQLIGDLCSNFKAVAIKATISRCLDTQENMTLANEVKFMEKYLKMETKKFTLPIDIKNDHNKEIVDTEANLKPKVFKNILSILGLEYKNAVEVREHYINSKLLANRNSIGHGSDFDQKNQDDFALTISDVEKLKEIIFSIIDDFKDSLQEYGNKKYYLTANLGSRIAYEAVKETELEKVFQLIEDRFKP